MVKRRARLGRARLRPRDQSAGGRRPDPGFGLDGDGTGAVRGDAIPRGTAASREPPRLSRADDRRVAADRCRSSSKRRIPTARSARRKPAKARCRDSCRRSPTRSPTRPDCGSPSCRRRPIGCWKRSPRGGARRVCARRRGQARRRRRGLRWNGSRRSRSHGPQRSPRPLACWPPTPGARLARRRHRSAAQPARRTRHAAEPLIDLGGIAGFDRIAATDGGTTIGAGVTLARLATDARHRAHAADPRRGRARRRGAGAPHRCHGRRQSLPRHPLRVLQPERMVAARERLLPQARRRNLPRRAAGRALSRRVLRRSRAGAAGARRRSRDRRAAGRPAHAARRSLCRRRRGAPDARRRARSSRPCTCRRSRRMRAPAIARRACAARSIFRSPASRRASTCATGRSTQLASRSPAPIRGRSCSTAPTALAGRPVDDEMLGANSASSCRSRRARCAPRSRTSNYRRQVAAVLAQRLVRDARAGCRVSPGELLARSSRRPR